MTSMIRIRASKRYLEWWLARFTCLYGLWLIIVPNSMDMEGYEIATAWLSPKIWGMGAFIVGAAHVTALLVPGQWIWSPLVRAIAASMNAFFFAVIGTSFAKVDIHSVSVAIYLFGLSWAGFIAFASAWRDCVAAYCTRDKYG